MPASARERGESPGPGRKVSARIAGKQVTPRCRNRHRTTLPSRDGRRDRQNNEMQQKHCNRNSRHVKRVDAKFLTPKRVHDRSAEDGPFSAARTRVQRPARRSTETKHHTSFVNLTGG